MKKSNYFFNLSFLVSTSKTSPSNVGIEEKREAIIAAVNNLSDTALEDYTTFEREADVDHM